MDSKRCAPPLQRFDAHDHFTLNAFLVIALVIGPPNHLIEALVSWTIMPSSEPL